MTRGITQYVILGRGAGLLRLPPSALAGAIRVFEVNHPRHPGLEARPASPRPGIPVPDATAFVPADFEHGELAARLRATASTRRPALVSWLGVTMYLTQPAISQTLAEIGTLAPGTELITDYMLPPGLRDAAGDSYAGLVGAGRGPARRAVADLPGPGRDVGPAGQPRLRDGPARQPAGLG